LFSNSISRATLEKQNKQVGRKKSLDLKRPHETLIGIINIYINEYLAMAAELRSLSPLLVCFVLGFG
jgi:hypothetical protein